MRRVNAAVGYRRLPSHVRGGSKASYAREFTLSVRDSMQGIIQRYSEVVSSLHGITPDILQAALLPTFDKSITYCPEDTGALVASGRIEVGTSSRGSARAAIIYGGPDIHYAPIVHERLDLNHAAPTRAKWLQSAMQEDFDEFLPRIQTMYRSAMRGA